MARIVEDKVFDHNYDGIQEYDNPTPGWWYAIFAGCVVFSVLYILVYHTMVPSLPQRHAAMRMRRSVEYWSRGT